jgi:diaminopimelate epimerase
MRFTKMEGLGNDYIYFNCLEESIEDPARAAKILCDRHFKIGGDGIVLILPSEKADFRMRMFNADGSEAEMCGNAIRCVAKYVYDRRLTKKDVLCMETLAGVLNLYLAIENGVVSKVRVDMGAPVLKGTQIPVAIDKEKVIGEPLTVSGQTFSMTCVSMGNPHSIIFVDEITDEHVLTLGPKIETHELFPRKVNVEFVKVLNRNEVQMRVWERGTGETIACGTGASAVAVAAALNGLTERDVTVHLRGGDLEIQWAEDGHVFMTGPANFAFEGDVEW